MVDDVAGGAVAHLEGQLVDATFAVAIHATHGGDGAGAHGRDLAWKPSKICLLHMVLLNLIANLQSSAKVRVV